MGSRRESEGVSGVWPDFCSNRRRRRRFRSTASTSCIRSRGFFASAATTRTTPAKWAMTVDREKPFYFSKSATALRQSGATLPYPPGTEQLSFRNGAGGRDRRPGVPDRRRRGARRGLRLRLRPRHDAARPAIVRTRQAAAVDARQGRRGERAGLGDRARSRASAIPPRGASRCARTARRASRPTSASWSGRSPKSSRISPASIILAPGDLIFTGTPAGRRPGRSRRPAGRRDRRRRRTDCDDRSARVSAAAPDAQGDRRHLAAPRWTASTSR